MLLLAGYANGHRRKRTSKSTRVPMRLPEPKWFLDRVTSAGLMEELHRVSRASAFEASHITKADVAALVVLDRGHCRQGHLTPWSSEGDLLWHYMGQPCACFTVKVKDMCLFDSKISVSSARDYKMNINLRHCIFQSNTKLVSRSMECRSRLNSTRVSIGDVLEALSMIIESMKVYDGVIFWGVWKKI